MVRQFRAGHPLAGCIEIGHALKVAVTKNPGDLPLAQELASEAGVRVDLSKSAEKGEEDGDPGDCEPEEYLSLRSIKIAACNGGAGGSISSRSKHGSVRKQVVRAFVKTLNMRALRSVLFKVFFLLIVQFFAVSLYRRRTDIV